VFQGSGTKIYYQDDCDIKINFGYFRLTGLKFIINQLLLYNNTLLYWAIDSVLSPLEKLLIDLMSGEH
jgi:hypothetical protein